jgi:hypothetical protein
MGSHDSPSLGHLHMGCTFGYRGVSSCARVKGSDAEVLISEALSAKCMVTIMVYNVHGLSWRPTAIF